MNIVKIAVSEVNEMKKHTFSALEKFIPGADVTSYRECKSLFAARGETVAFQFAVYNDENPGFVKVSVDGAGLDGLLPRLSS